MTTQLEARRDVSPNRCAYHSLPPFRVLDAEHVLAPHLGCDQLTRAVLRARSRLHVFGQVHGSYGRETGPDGIRFVNCAVLARLTDNEFGLREPIVVELESGLPAADA